VIQPLALPPPPGPVHFVGIGGAGMIGLARLLLADGYRVSGSDRADTPALAALRAGGATVYVGHDAAQVGDAALVIITAAVNTANPEVAAALARGIPVVKRAALLGLLANTRRLIAVAGTAGKSTTSGMVAFALSRLGLDPWYAVGAEVRDLGTSAFAGAGGAGGVGVVEADEYDYSFLHLAPRVAVVTNMEYDHPDLFPNEATYRDAFAQFAARVVPDGLLITNADDPACEELAQSHERNGGRVERVGRAEHADWRIVVSRGVVLVWHGGAMIGPLAPGQPGEHNLYNAAMAAAACAAVGADAAATVRVLSAYGGVGRRFELLGEAGGVAVIDDYAHHPTKVRATLAAARARYPHRRVVAVLQPHTYSRTALFVREFGAALGGADVALVTDIYAAREANPGTVAAEDVVSHIPTGRGRASGDLAATLDVLRGVAKPGDVVLVMGAGDVTVVGPRLLAALREGAGETDDPVQGGALSPPIQRSNPVEGGL